MNKSFAFIVIFIFLLSGCNSNLSEEERKDLWKKAQTTGEIINRSGTPFNSAVDKDLALGDAQNRLITGGGLLGNKASFSFLGNDENNSSQISSVGLPINPYLWKASLETIDFMPLSSTDPFAGIIITDWYTVESNIGERCKLNVFVKGADFKTDSLKVSSFCQSFENNQWVNKPSIKEDNTRLENIIFNNAKKLKLTSG